MALRFAVTMRELCCAPSVPAVRSLCPACSLRTGRCAEQKVHQPVRPHPRSPGVYSKTVNLPQTKFDMRANSVVREPQLQQFWQENRIYEQLSRENPGVSEGAPHARCCRGSPGPTSCLPAIRQRAVRRRPSSRECRHEGGREDGAAEVADEQGDMWAHGRPALHTCMQAGSLSLVRETCLARPRAAQTQHPARAVPGTLLRARRRRRSHATSPPPSAPPRCSPPSRCMTARPTQTATCTSGTRSTRS